MNRNHRFHGQTKSATHQVSSHNQSIAEHFEQKCRSDNARVSSGVSRFNTALYILSSTTTAYARCIPHTRGEKETYKRPLARTKKTKLSVESRLSRDAFFSLGDLERVRVRSEVGRSTRTAHLSADGTEADLIWHRCARLDCESHRSAMAASLELHWHGFIERRSEALLQVQLLLKRRSRLQTRTSVTSPSGTSPHNPS
jgi:hypothetical protein